MHCCVSRTLIKTKKKRYNRLHSHNISSKFYDVSSAKDENKLFLRHPKSILYLPSPTPYLTPHTIRPIPSRSSQSPERNRPISSNPRAITHQSPCRHLPVACRHPPTSDMSQCRLRPQRVPQRRASSRARRPACGGSSRARQRSVSLPPPPAAIYGGSSEARRKKRAPRRLHDATRRRRDETGW